MQAILMAGGRGTRLRPYTAVIPKPLVPLGDLSIIEVVLRQLRYHGFDRVTIAVGYKAEIVMAVVGDGSRFGLRIDYHREMRELGTVGAIAEMSDLEENFLVMNGDICCNMDFRAMYEDHVRGGAAATVGTYARHEQLELGVMELDAAESHVVGFREKPVYDFFVSMGVNAFKRSTVSLIPKGVTFGFDKLILKMLGLRIPIRCHRFSGLWLDIGRPDDYDRACQELERNPRAYLPEGA